MMAGFLEEKKRFRGVCAEATPGEGALGRTIATFFSLQLLGEFIFNLNYSLRSHFKLYNYATGCLSMYLEPYCGIIKN